MAASDWQTIIGLEVHAEMLTETKMLSNAPVVDSVSSSPNSAVDPLSMGLPGTLPVINFKAMEWGMMVGLALNCEIPPFNQRRQRAFRGLVYGFGDIAKMGVTDDDQTVAGQGAGVFTGLEADLHG